MNGFRMPPNHRSKLSLLLKRTKGHRPRWLPRPKPEWNRSQTAEEWAAINEADPCRLYLGAGRRV